MLGRIVILDTDYQSVSVVQDLIEAKLDTDQAGFVLRAKIMQSSDEAAAEAEELQVNLKRATGAFTSGSGGGSATVSVFGPAAHSLATIERNNTTQAVIGTGTLDVVEPGVFNILAGEWEWHSTPETMIPLGPSEAAILSIDEAPADAITLRAILVLLITHG